MNFHRAAGLALLLLSAAVARAATTRQLILETPAPVSAPVVVDPNAATNDYSFISGSLPQNVTFSRASTATCVGPDASQVFTEIAANVPCMSSVYGVRHEPHAATNYVNNPRFIGAVTGTGAAAPGTGYSYPTLSGTASVAAVGTTYGMRYVDIIYAGTTTSYGTFVGLNFPTTGPSGTGSYTLSSYTSLVSGTLPSGFLCELFAVNGGSTYYGTATTPTGLDIRLQRSAYSFTNSNGGTFTPGFRCRSPTAGVSYSLTVRFLGPQVEDGSSVSSLILPSGSTIASSTRAAENMNAPLTGYSQSVGATIEWDGLWQYANGVNTAIAVRATGNLTTTASQLGFITGASSASTNARVNGTSITTSGVSAGTAFKLSLSAAPGTQLTALNGVAKNTGTVATLPTALTYADWGSDINATRNAIYSTLWTKRLQFWTTPRTQTQINSDTGS